MPEGKYFIIKSQLTGLVIDIKGNECAAGLEIITSEERPLKSNDTQIWYEEQFTGTIRSKLLDLCLTINDDNVLIVDEFQDINKNQEWIVVKDKLQSKIDASTVLQLAGGSDEPEAKVSKGTFQNGVKEQLWDIKYLDAIYFYIVSEMHGKVISVAHGDRKTDAKVTVDDKIDEADHQLWYEGKLGHIRSKMNDYVLESKQGEKGASTRLMPFEPGNPKQLWTQYGPKLVSLIYPKFLLAIKGKSHHNHAKLVINYDENLPHQRWILHELW